MAKEHEIAKLQTTWRAAYRKSEPLIIPCPTIAAARNIRFRLYGAVKDVRKGSVEADQELTLAVDSLQVSAVEEPSPRVILQRKATLDLLDAALAAEGFDAASIKTAEELAIEASAKRMEELQRELDRGSAGAAHQPSPHTAGGNLDKTFPGQAPRERPDPAEVVGRTIGAKNPFFTRGDGPGQSS